MHRFINSLKAEPTPPDWTLQLGPVDDLSPPERSLPPAARFKRKELRWRALSVLTYQGPGHKRGENIGCCRSLHCTVSATAGAVCVAATDAARTTCSVGGWRPRNPTRKDHSTSHLPSQISLPASSVLLRSRVVDLCAGPWRVQMYVGMLL